MYFLIKTEQAAGGMSNDEVVKAHRAYLALHAAQIVAVGPTFFENGDAPEGSMYLFEAEGWGEVRRFVAQDPLTIANARKKVQIWAWVKKGFDGIYPLA